MLAHRHTNNRREFNALAKRLELGADYPTDVSEAARFRPDTPLVRYLDPLIRQIHIIREELGDTDYKTTEDERSMLLHLWYWELEDLPGDEELSAIRAARKLPTLTKTTWAEKALLQELSRLRREDCRAGRLQIAREHRAQERAEEANKAEWQRKHALSSRMMQRMLLVDSFAQPDMVSQAMAFENAESLLQEASE
ncbi:MAG TPA: hypothetical protein VFZ59_09635 [Verrucomicrobiae bacterium]|nr:hypothetical protein [Verrucomicrobiae bacterium]